MQVEYSNEEKVVPTGKHDEGNLTESEDDFKVPEMCW